MKKTNLFLLLFLLTSSACASYPASWWKKVEESERKSWEILPQDAKKGEVILSKRNELGIFSNLSKSPFVYKNEKYASIEGLWQMMKYPEPKLSSDIRNNWKGYKYTREQVKGLHGFKSKKAGDQANALMNKNRIKWVSYEGQRFNYKDKKTGSELHYEIIFEAIKEKVLQNPEIRELLVETKGLILRPDHKQRSSSPDSYRYHKILMKIRETL